MKQTQEIRPVMDEIIIIAMKFVTHQSALFELRNANSLVILSLYGTFHCKLIPSCNRAIVLSCHRAISHWFACNERDFSDHYIKSLIVSSQLSNCL